MVTAAIPQTISVKLPHISTRPQWFQPRDVASGKDHDPAKVDQIVRKYDPDTFEALWVVKDPEKKDSYIVIAGHHRLEAAHRLELGEVPVRVLEGNPAKEHDRRRLAHKADVSNYLVSTPGLIEQVTTVRRMSADEYTDREISDIIRKRLPEVERLKYLAAMPIDVLTMVNVNGEMRGIAETLGEAKLKGWVDDEAASHLFKRAQDAFDETKQVPSKNALRKQLIDAFEKSKTREAQPGRMEGFGENMMIGQVFDDASAETNRQKALSDTSRRLTSCQQLADDLGVPIDTVREAAQAKLDALNLTDDQVARARAVLDRDPTPGATPAERELESIVEHAEDDQPSAAPQRDGPTPDAGAESALNLFGQMQAVPQAMPAEGDDLGGPPPGAERKDMVDAGQMDMMGSPPPAEAEHEESPNRPGEDFFDQSADVPEVAPETGQVGQATLGEGFETNRSLMMPLDGGSSETQQPLIDEGPLRAAQERHEQLDAGQMDLMADEPPADALEQEPEDAAPDAHDMAEGMFVEPTEPDTAGPTLMADEPPAYALEQEPEDAAPDARDMAEGMFVEPTEPDTAGPTLMADEPPTYALEQEPEDAAPDARDMAEGMFVEPTEPDTAGPTLMADEPPAYTLEQEPEDAAPDARDMAEGMFVEPTEPDTAGPTLMADEPPAYALEQEPQAAAPDARDMAEGMFVEPPQMDTAGPTLMADEPATYMLAQEPQAAAPSARDMAEVRFVEQPPHLDTTGPVLMADEPATYAPAQEPPNAAPSARDMAERGVVETYGVDTASPTLMADEPPAYALAQDPQDAAPDARDMAEGMFVEPTELDTAGPDFFDPPPGAIQEESQGTLATGGDYSLQVVAPQSQPVAPAQSDDDSIEININVTDAPAVELAPMQQDTTTKPAKAKRKKKKADKTPEACAPETVENKLDALHIELGLQEQHLEDVEASRGGKAGVSKMERIELAEKAVSSVKRRIRTEEKKLGGSCPTGGKGVRIAVPALPPKRRESVYARSARKGQHPAVRLRKEARRINGGK